MVNDTDIEVLKYLTQFLSISQIAKQRKVSRTAIYKVINRLIKNGLIRKIGKAYEVTDEGLHSFNKSSNLIRLHNLAIKVRIIHKPNNWDLKRSQIVQIRSLSKQIDIKNNSYEIHSFSNLKIKTTNNSIIFYLPSYYGKDTDDCFQQALNSLFNSIPKIENLFKVILIKDRKCNMEIISNHYAKLQDSLARLYKTENNKLHIRDEDGNIWLIADYSFRIDELETIYKTAKEDMDSVQKFLNDLRKNPLTLSEMMNMIQNVTANQVIFDKNMKSHIQAVKDLSKGVKRLSNIMADTIEENKKLKLGNQKSIYEYF